MPREKISGRVDSIIDPNTIRVAGRKIFIRNWDDPELYSFENRKSLLRDKILGRSVTVEIVSTSKSGELNGDIYTGYKSKKNSSSTSSIIVISILILIIILIFVLINIIN